MGDVGGHEKAREYWQRNIGAFGKVYANALSQEEFESPAWLGALYKAFVLPVEKRLMKERYLHTVNFINQFVEKEQTAVDIGCGTGIFTVEMLRRGAKVIAIDYVESAINLTRLSVEKAVPELTGNVEYRLMDVTAAPLPASDVAIAVGVTPYVNDLSAFMHNILGSTKGFYCLYLDPNHWANRLRASLPLLNVRHVRCFASSEIDRLLARDDFQLVNRTPFATGYLDHAVLMR